MDDKDDKDDDGGRRIVVSPRAACWREARAKNMIKKKQKKKQTLPLEGFENKQTHYYFLIFFTLVVVCVFPSLLSSPRSRFGGDDRVICFLRNRFMVYKVYLRHAPPPFLSRLRAQPKVFFSPPNRPTPKFFLKKRSYAALPSSFRLSLNPCVP